MEIIPWSAAGWIGDTIEISIKTTGDSLTVKTDEKTSVFSYTRPVEITGKWEIVLSFIVENAGPDSVYIDAFKLLAGESLDELSKIATITGVELPPVAPKFYTLVADPDTLPFGGGTTNISWTSDADSVRCPDGHWVTGPSGSVEVQTEKDSTFGFLAMKGLNQSLTKVTVTVLPALTYADFFQAHDWGIDSMWLKIYEEDSWQVRTIDSAYAARWTEFLEGGFYYTYKPPNDIVDMGYWSVVDNHLIWGDAWNIDEINDTSFKVWQKIPSEGIPDSIYIMRKYKVHQ